MLLPRSLIALVAFSLSACSGDSSEGGAFCDSISGGGAQLTSTCAGCTIQNEAAAADNNLHSSADAHSTAGAANIAVTLRSTAQDGIVYPAGSKAGAFFTAPSSSGVTIATYLDGVRQENQSGLTNYFVEGRGSPAELYSGINTLLPFDAVEISASVSATAFSSSSIALQTYEICSHGGVQ